MEAQANGYAEAIALGADAMVSEGSGQNLFLVRDNVVMTPPINGSNLSGLTRRSVIELAKEAGLEASESARVRLPRRLLKGREARLV